MTVFVSRDLSPDDILAQKMAEKGWPVRGRALVELLAVPFLEVPDCNWVFFYSKNAVRFFSKTADAQKIHFPDGLRWAAMSEATAAALENWLRRPADFVGDGDSVSTAANFLSRARGQKVLFPRASASRESISKLLEKSIETLDLIVFENKIASVISPADEQILAFTSPMSAEAYFSKNKLKKGQKLVAIGRSTAEQLEKMGFSNVKIAPEATENGLATAIFSVF